MNPVRLTRLCFIMLTFALTTVYADDWKDESGKGKKGKDEKKWHEQDKRDRDRYDFGRWGRDREDERWERYDDRYRYGNDDPRSYFRRHGYTRLNIPKGHYPPPGECRIWYPGRPAGHQPPPGNCDRLYSSVPPGAWMIHRPDWDRDRVYVNAYDPYRRGRVLVTGEFSIGGALLRILAGN